MQNEVQQPARSADVALRVRSSKSPAHSTMGVTHRTDDRARAHVDAAGPLRVRAHAVTAMHAHASKTAPQECCGVLVGSATTGIVEAAWPAANIAQTPRRAFELDPFDLLALEDRAAELELDILGVYHSHPQQDASPSVADKATAVPSWYYVIMGCARGQAKQTRAWRIAKEGDMFAEEVMVVV